MKILKMLVIFGYICCWFSGIIILAMGIGRFLNKNYIDEVIGFFITSIIVIVFLCLLYNPLTSWVW